MIKNNLNRFFFKLIILILKNTNNNGKNYIVEFLFKNNSKNLIFLAGTFPYFANFTEKKIISDKIRAYQENKKILTNIAIKNNDKKVVNSLEQKGIFDKLSIKIPQKDIFFVNKYFDKKNYYDFHIPLKSKKNPLI